MSDDVDIGLKVHTEGESLLKQLAQDLNAARNSLFALSTAARANSQDMARQTAVLQQQLTALDKIAAQGQKTLSGTAGATDALSFSVGGLVKTVLAAATAFAGFQGFKTFISEGLEFNKTIETANLGIASLITSQTEMKNKQGEVVTGVDKLRIAQELATDQVNKLRIAGLQTTATTEELVVAFQQAVGVGLRWGLTLDQIRGLTIQMSQAAGALGLPMNQLNEEVRDLLGGNINPRNTRIATALGITNEQIRQAQKAGTLFDFVTKRLEAFSIAGEATAKSFSGVMSNVKEAVQNLAGDATKPLFDSLKETGQRNLEEIFDLKNARISSKFAGILDVAKTVFGGIGDLLSNALDGAVDGAKEFSKWLEQNNVVIAQTFAAISAVGDEVGSLVKDVISLFISLGQVSTESGGIKAIFQGIGLIISFIHTAFQGLVIILGTIGSFVLTAIVAPFVGWLKILARITNVFNAELGKSLDDAATSGEDFIKNINDGLASYVQNIAESGNATDQYILKLVTMDAQAEKSALAHDKLSKAIAAATDQETKEIAVLDAALKAKTISQQQYADKTTKVKLESITKQIAAEKAYFNGLDVADNRERRRTLTTIEELKKRAAAVAAQPTLKSTAPLDQKDSASKAAQGETILIKAELAKRLADLKSLLDQQLISYHNYYAQVIEARQTAIDREIAALRKLEATQTDKGAIAKTEDQIKALMLKREQIVVEEGDKERDAYQKMADDVTKAHVELLKDQGRLVDAANIETLGKFRKLIAQLKEEVKAGKPGAANDLSIVEQLFGIEQAKVKLQELTQQATGIQATLGTKLDEIGAESKAGAIDEAQARERTVKALKQAHDQLSAMLPIMRAQAEATGDPTAINAVDQLAIKVQQLGVQIAQASDELIKLKQGAKEALGEGLASFIDDATRGAKSLHDAWRDAAQGIVDSLRRIASQMLATLIIQKALQLFGFSGGGLVSTGGSTGATLSGGAGSSGPVFAASGGFISGPGSPTSDSIPAWLSNGEYVLNAKATRAMGIENLDAINYQFTSQVRPRRRGGRGFADGGLVSSQSNDSTVNSHLTVGLEQGLIVTHMKSNEGQKVTLRTIERNASAVRRALGL